MCGSDIGDYARVSKNFEEGDFFIYCDSGLKHQEKFKENTTVNITPNLIVGDFDSYKRPDTDIEVIELPREKDDTDSVFAMKEAINRGFKEFLFVGAAGNRLDHTLVNVYALLKLYKSGFRGTIVDDYSEMIIVGNDNPECVSPDFSYFSLVTLVGDAKGVTIKGAKFPLDKAVISSDYQYATSNEVAGNEPAVISIDKGFLLLMKVY